MINIFEQALKIFFCRTLASLLKKFRINASEVIIIPDVTKKADNETKEQFQKMTEDLHISDDQLSENREKTNR